MTEIYVLRHCKSDWSGNLQADRDRPLSARGVRDAGRMGHWMKENEYLPAIIFCSTAVRARQTTQLVCEQLSVDQNQIHYLPELYLASCSTLLSTIKAQKNEQGSMMMVGHNPGMDELVSYLADRDVPLTEQGKLMTTGCLARFRLLQMAKDLHRQAELLSITRPSEI